MAVSHSLHILIADDDSLVGRSLCETLSFDGYTCHWASSGSDALAKLREAPFDILISDMKMPGMDGLTLLKNVRSSFPDTAVIMVTGFGSIEDAVAAMREGALDYVTKPVNDDEIKIIIQRIAQQRSLMEENAYLRDKLSATTRERYFDIVGKSFKMQKIYDLIELIAETKTTILITGESGTGKGLIARAIHARLSRGEALPFVEVSCGALPEALLESELFGHVKGAFTGAIKDRIGRFESADGGTIFLDEIDCFTPALQVKLLRVLQDGEYERVGETTTRKTAARIIAATNQNLEQCIRDGKFRNDLYYRLNIISMEMPPLRDRQEDIPLLVGHFISKHATALAKSVKEVSGDVLEKIMHYSWPGNVRELENVMERACVLAQGPQITLSELPEAILRGSGGCPPGGLGETMPRAEKAAGARLKDALKDPERLIILEALEKCRWNKKETARLLGINRTTLYKKLSLYQIMQKS